ncbi:FecR domain-containing protein [Flavivirga amylovorans]|uniref:FecR domain-containing protein n=1 Tax=Flavivirga amylovorans TaxID=870486 RepID=A0ABT8WVU9_9FLAO|nr:FecR family protein [Flavivirga amylovorans]MDO5985802.1 FecR domain-containing protein [Flavivirga amylovorans]
MNAPKVEKALAKYLINEASAEDLDFLSEWIKDPENEKIFDTYVKIHYETIVVMNQPDVDSIKEKLLKKIKRDKNLFYSKKFVRVFKYAAILIVSLSLGYIYINTQKEEIIPKEDFITIELDNGLLETIDTEGNIELKDTNGNIIGKQNKTKLTYHNDTNIEKLVYNTLNVPYGKQFDLVLSDGTHVYLNAGTSLRYPVKFLQGQKREVFLKGEAFFDVTADKAHPFIVNANSLDVEVLGTQFVVSLYEEDKVTSVVLVEGSVDLHKENTSNTTRLIPGTRGVLDGQTGAIEKTKVNTNLYTAWMDGVLIFRNQTFENISKKLERIYNVSIVSRNTDFSKEVFNASFDNETIADILSYFKDSYHMNYTIENNIIYIN